MLRALPGHKGCGELIIVSSIRDGFRGKRPGINVENAREVDDRSTCSSAGWNENGVNPFYREHVRRYRVGNTSGGENGRGSIIRDAQLPKGVTVACQLYGSSRKFQLY